MPEQTPQSALARNLAEEGLLPTADHPDLALVPWPRRALREILTRAGLRPTKRFGQNFLTDRNLLDAIVRDADVTPGDHVLEVGPGTGELTAALLSAGAEVLAVEIDRGLAALVGTRFAHQPRFNLLLRDVLTRGHLADDIATRLQAWAPFKLVANLPYSAGTPVLLDLCIRPELNWTTAVATVQREVAERLVAPPGTEAYGLAAVLAQAFAHATIVRHVPPDVFWPRPKVDSSVVRLTPRPDPLIPDPQRQAFAAFCRQLLQQRRKTLRRALHAALPDAGADRIAPLLATQQLDPQTRAERLTPTQFAALFEAGMRG